MDIEQGPPKDLKLIIQTLQRNMIKSNRHDDDDDDQIYGLQPYCPFISKQVRIISKKENHKDWGLRF